MPKLPSEKEVKDILKFQYTLECTRQGVTAGQKSSQPTADVQPDTTTDSSRPQSMFDLIRESAESKKETGLDEMSEYLKEGLLDEEQCPLKYWKRNSSKFPILANIAKKFLAIPATSSGIERIFSIAGALARARRAKLLPATLEMVVMLRQHRKPILLKRLQNAGRVKTGLVKKRKRATC